ncbi:aldo/keto reductase [Streptomyces sp. DB-54]
MTPREETRPRPVAHPPGPPGQIALAWLLAQQPWIAPIPSTRRTEHVAENAAATSVALSADDIAALNTLTSTGVHGARYSRQQMALVDTATS